MALAEETERREVLNIDVARVMSVDIDRFEFSWAEQHDLFIGGAINALGDELSASGFPRRACGASGYKGWRAGPVLLGYSAQGGYCQSGGAFSARVFQALQGTPGLRCSRIDVQVTVELCQVDERLAHRAVEACAEAAAMGVDGVPRKTPLYGQDGEGWTAYLGAPSSDKRARIYDKGAEVGGAEIGRFWRFEYQLRRAYAKAVYRALCGVVSYKQIIANTVAGWLRPCGIILAVGGDYGDTISIGSRRATDDEKSMAWLREGVAPSVFRLAQGAHRDELKNLVASWALAVGLLEPDEI